MSFKYLGRARRTRGLTPTQKLVLLLLADTANDDGVCWIGALALADDSGLSDRAVRTALHDLLGYGLVSGTMRSGVKPMWTLTIEESGTTFHTKRNGVPVPKRNHVPLNRKEVPGSNRKQVPTKPETRSDKAEPGSDEPPRTTIEPKRATLSSVRAPEAVDEPAEAFKLWNEMAGPKLGPALKLSDTRRTLLRARLDDIGGLAQWPAFLRRILASPFLTGGGERGWTADLDWCLKASNAVRIAEGRYDPRGPASDPGERRSARAWAREDRDNAQRRAANMPGARGPIIDGDFEQ